MSGFSDEERVRSDRTQKSRAGAGSCLFWFSVISSLKRTRAFCWRGRGIKKICDACREYGSPDPEFQLSGEMLTVKFSARVASCMAAEAKNEANEEKEGAEPEPLSKDETVYAETLGRRY